MTRKDYVLISRALKRAMDRTASFEQDQREGIKHAAYILSIELKADNRAFDQERFMRDAGVTP